jgi:hypothetical protein
MTNQPNRVSIEDETKVMRRVVAAFDSLRSFPDADRARQALLDYLRSRYAKAEA